MGLKALPDERPGDCAAACLVLDRDAVHSRDQGVVRLDVELSVGSWFDGDHGCDAGGRPQSYRSISAKTLAISELLECKPMRQGENPPQQCDAQVAGQRPHPCRRAGTALGTDRLA